MMSDNCPSLPDSVRGFLPCISLPNVGSLATVGVNVLSPKNTVPTLFDSLLAKHSNSQETNHLNNITSAITFKFPNNPKQWKILNAKIKTAIAPIDVDIKIACLDPHISSTAISAALWEIFHSVLRDSLPPSNLKVTHSSQPPQTQKRTPEQIKLLSSQITIVKNKIKDLIVPIIRAGKDVRDARSRKDKKHNKQRRLKKKKLLTERKNLLAILKKLSSELETIDRSKEERKGVWDFLKHPWNFVKNLMTPTSSIKPSASLPEKVKYYTNMYSDPHPLCSISDPTFMNFTPSITKKMTENIPTISTSDWIEMLKSKKSSSAPGWDGIGYDALKNLPSIKEALIPLE
jgi:hypothetical protein